MGTTVETMSRRQALRRILAISGGVAGAVAAGTVLTACTPGAGGGGYSNYYSNSGSSSSYDNYAHRYIVSYHDGTLGYTHYGDGHDR
jgi:hypothetical protein